MPTCLHVGLQNRRFSDFWRFQEAFKISSFFASIFYRFWLRLGLQHGAILGAKTAQNLKRWYQKFGAVLSKSGSGHDLAFNIVQDRVGIDFEGLRGRFSQIFGSFFEHLGLLWVCFRLLLLSLFLVSSSAKFAKKIQEHAEDKAENP